MYKSAVVRKFQKGGVLVMTNIIGSFGVPNEKKFDLFLFREGVF